MSGSPFGGDNVGTFAASAEWYEGTPPKCGLLDVFPVDGGQLTAFAQQNVLSDGLPEPWAGDVQRVFLGARAHLQFQDMQRMTLDAPSLSRGLSMEDLLNRNYLYYESIAYLRESVLCWANGRTLAAITLLRPFLELAVMHLYWYLTCEKAGYKAYYTWLDEQHPPKFDSFLKGATKALQETFPTWTGRIRRLARALRGLYTSLCAYNHGSSVSESLTAIGIEASMTYYAVMADMILMQIAFAYVLAYPMILFPVELYEKFGFSGPMGCYADPRTSGIVQHYLGSENVTALKQGLQHSADVQHLLDWYSNLPFLGVEELEASWRELSRDPALDIDGSKITDPRQRATMAKAQFRALCWALTYVPSRIPSKFALAQDLPDELTDRLATELRKW